MNKKIIPISGIIILAIIAGSFWFLQKGNVQEKNNTKKEEIKTVTNKAKDTNVAISDSEQNIEKLSFDEVDTSNWQIYRNEELRFEIRYPEMWALEDYLSDDMGRSVALHNSNVMKNNKLDSIFISYYSSLSEYFYDTADGLLNLNAINFDSANLDVLLRQHPLLKDIKKIKCANFNGISTSENGAGTTLSVFTTNNRKNLYNISFDVSSDIKDLDKVHRAILNSFKIIE